MKALVIYHDHCTDGFGAAYAAYLKFGDSAEYLPMSYKQDFNPVICEGRDVYVLDFSFSQEVTHQIIELSNYFVWLDHHKTAFEMWCPDHSSLYIDETERTHIILDNEKSGALLAFLYFHPGVKIPMYIKYIDDRDRWKFKYGGSKAFHAGMSTMKPWTFDVWNDALGDMTQILVAGEVILLHDQKRVSAVSRKAQKCLLVARNHETDEVWKYEGLAVNCRDQMSEIGHELANASGTFGLVWYWESGSLAHVSIRSNGDYDVSTIAKHFDGGGHKNAAGFTVSMETLLRWVK